ncbi:MAG: GMC family oxidoreductase [Magnetospirillum sp.]|nr:GMC family oxidoreductase [Magnetospirillum sp.]
MILDARQMPDDERLTADVCIVGGGPAGITLAHELIGSGLSVILAEAGGEKPDGDLWPVFGGEVLTARHPPSDLYRSRCLGGTSALWGGRCAPFDNLDFEARDWVPYSGWPIARADLDDAYGRAARYCDLGRADWRVNGVMRERAPEMIPGFTDPVLDTAAIDRFSPPVRFGERYRDAIAASGNLRVLLNANCLSLGLAPSADHVAVLRMASVPGRRFTVTADACVLAAGGLETPRLLLESDDVVPTGIGNAKGLVGRFYLCHLQGKAGVVKLHTSLDGVVHEYERDEEGVYCRRKLRIVEAEQRRLRLMNVAVRFEHPAIPDPGHRSGILSAMYLSRHFLAREYSRKLAECGLNGENGRPPLATLALHVRNILIDAPSVAGFAARWFPNRRWGTRRIPYVSPPNRDNRFHLDYYAEQAPNPDSRVMLAPERDAFGRRRLRIDWRTSAQDHDNVVATYRLMKERLLASGLGDLVFDEAQLRSDFGAIGGHHIGTARMADDPSLGVVDPDCRVFGVDNLYIASAAVFPTTGHVSPTLTAVAFAVRLADHLRSRMGRGRWDGQASGTFGRWRPQSL